MLETIIRKKIDELEKEKFKKNIEASRLKEIDIQLKQYKGMLKQLQQEE